MKVTPNLVKYVSVMIALLLGYGTQVTADPFSVETEVELAQRIQTCLDKSIQNGSSTEICEAMSFPECIPLPDSTGSTGSVALCFGHQIGAWNIILEHYIELERLNLKSLGESYSTNLLTLAETAQTNWEEYVTADCNYVFESVLGGSAENPSKALCILEHTITRVLILAKRNEHF